MTDAEPAQIPFRESEVEALVAQHLIRSGYEVSRETRVASGIIDLVAVKEGRSLVVEVKGEDAGGYTSAQMNFLMALGQIASRMTEGFDDFAVAIPATDHFERVLSKFEGSSGFRKLGISLFLVKRDGALEVR
jgi:hypothetical protein